MRWRWALFPFNPLYGGAVRLRELAYKYGMLRSTHLGPRTISVGNIEVGGTGKSPFVSGLIAAITAKGGRPVVLARGYRSGLQGNAAALFLGGQIKSVKNIISGSPLAICALHADEARMISSQHHVVPVIIGRDRKAAFRIFHAEISDYNPTHLVLDDGFQHWQIARDVDVVLISENIENETLLPSGNLRESISALDRAGFVIRVTGRNITHPMVAKKSVSSRPIVRRSMRRSMRRPMEARVRYGALTCMFSCDSQSTQLPSSPVAICGIARPKPFLDAVRMAGIAVLRVLALNDHQAFSKSDLSSAFLSGADAIVTTEKDFWRDPEILKATNLPVWILPMRIEFSYDLLL